MSFLAVMLFVPWFAVIAFAYWHYPRNPAPTKQRRGFDVAALLLAIGIATISAWAAVNADWQNAGKIWPQVAAVLFAYAAFLLIILLAALIRQRLWCSPRGQASL